MEMQKAILDENVIPPMTHPYGSVWRQPDPKNIVLDKKKKLLNKIEGHNSPPGKSSKRFSKCGNHSAYYCRKNWDTDENCISCTLIKRYRRHILKTENDVQLKECPTCRCFFPLRRYYLKTTRYKDKVYHSYSSSCKICTSTKEAEKIRNRKKKGLLPVL